MQRLGLQQSLTPSRNNGLLNMLKPMQRKALQFGMEAERGENLQGVDSHSRDNNGIALLPPEEQADGKPSVEIQGTAGVHGGPAAVASREERIKQKLDTALEPIVLEIEDVSYQHAGHAAVQGGANETHFNVKIVSDKFKGLSLVKRHRLVYGLLDKELRSGLHALSIVAKSPDEVQSM